MKIESVKLAIICSLNLFRINIIGSWWLLVGSSKLLICVSLKTVLKKEHFSSRLDKCINETKDSLYILLWVVPMPYIIFFFI